MSAQPEWTPPELRPQQELLAMIEYVTENGYSSNPYDGYDKGSWPRSAGPPASPALRRSVTLPSIAL